MTEEGIESLEISIVIQEGDKSAQLVHTEVTTENVYFSSFIKTQINEFSISEEKWSSKCWSQARTAMSLSRGVGNARLAVIRVHLPLLCTSQKLQ